MKRDFCVLVLDIIYSKLNDQDRFFKIEESKPSGFDECCPMFVTWKTVDGNVLRGCIGTTRPVNLIEGLERFAVRSAFHDSRFPPIDASELHNLKCTVSFLTDYEDCTAFDDWTIGVHGISFELNKDGRRYHSIFLPEVILEHGLDQESALHQLLLKSGYSGIITRDLLETLKVTRFQSKKATLAFQEYLQIRKKRMK